MVKEFWKSKLFWLGVVNVALGLLNYFQGHLSNGTELTINGVLIILLRAITYQPVGFTKKP